MTATANPTTQTTVGELVAQRPSRSRVFEKLGIDYCCGGKLPLAKACAAKGLDADLVLTTMLAAEEGTSSQEQNWAGATLSSLADHIEQTHHAYLKRELPRLGAIARKVASVHGEHHPWTRELDNVYARFAMELESHMRQEERELFPLIRCLESGEATSGESCSQGVDSPIQALEHEHDDAARGLERMRELSSGYSPPPGACNTFCALLDGLRELELDMHRHVHKENSILFPKALELERQLASSSP